jgi:hypothetical protein
MSVRATEDALLLQRLLKAVNGIQEEVWHSCSGYKRPITVHCSKLPVNSRQENLFPMSHGRNWQIDRFLVNTVSTTYNLLPIKMHPLCCTHAVHKLTFVTLESPRSALPIRGRYASLGKTARMHAFGNEFVSARLASEIAELLSIIQAHSRPRADQHLTLVTLGIPRSQSLTLLVLCRAITAQEVISQR